MGRRRKNTKGDLIAGLAVLIAIPFISNPEAAKSFLISTFQFLIVILLIGFVIWLLSKKKSADNKLYHYPIENQNNKSRIEPKINSSVDTAPIVPIVIKAEKRFSHSDANKEWSLSLINSLEWKRFEELCAGYFSQKGYRAEISRQGADGGIDIFLYKESYSTTRVFGVVQCKAWNTYKVGVKPVRELFGVMTAEQAPLGVFMTSGAYTQEAEQFAQGKPLKLLTGKSLLELLKSLPEDSHQSLLNEITEGDYTTPSCPSCGIKMAKRTSNKGRNAGNDFWGCINYPSCRNTLQIKKA